MQIQPLSAQLTTTFAKEICSSLDQIPSVEKHDLEHLLAQSKGERILHAKWRHSLLALSDDGSYLGVIIGYEREGEGNKQYPANSIYLSDLAVAKEYQGQGFGRMLVTKWLELNRRVSFIELTGNLAFSVQTNFAPWNVHVQKLYESFGFRKIAEKVYDNRVDGVYWMEE